MDPIKYIFEKSALTGWIAQWPVLLSDFNVKLLKVYEDSTLVIHQLRGEWETRDHKLIPYKAYIKELAGFSDEISFHHVP